MNGNARTTWFPRWLQIILVGRNPKLTMLRLITLVLSSCALIATMRYVIAPIRVTGISMEPTYHNGRITFLNRLSYSRAEPARGDVVGIRFWGDHVLLLKRIVGLPGETVSFLEGNVVVDGKPIPEPYLKNPSNWKLPPIHLGPDEYYIVGDNRSMDAADHEKGVRKKSQIVGKVLL
jgi:signal peptidase I